MATAATRTCDFLLLTLAPAASESPHAIISTGAYTTARTVDGGRLVFKLSSHIQRLATSANLMMDADMRVSEWLSE